MTNCVFCRIASGGIAAHLVHQDELTVAFLDTHPIRPGHVQVIPRQHYAYFDDLPTATAMHIVQIGQSMARALKRIQGVPRVAFCHFPKSSSAIVVELAGLTLPHSSAMLVRVVCSGRRLVEVRCSPLQARADDVRPVARTRSGLARGAAPG